MYRVYNENNVKVTVTEEQLEEFLDQNGRLLPLEIIGAMSESLDHRFAPRLIEALNHETQRGRIKAAYGLLSLLDKKYLNELRVKEQSIPEEDLNRQISEKAILQAVIIRLEKGTEGAKWDFFTDEIKPQIKSHLLFNYSSSNMPLTEEDIEFLVSALEVYVSTSDPWIQKMKRTDYEEDMIACVEAILRVSETSNLLSHLDDNLYEQLSNSCSNILNSKIDPYAKEVIATFARSLPPKIAFTMLEPIMNGRVRGDIRKELDETIKILRQKELEME